MAERQQPQLSRRDARREFNLQTYGTNIPNAEERRAFEAAQPSAAKKLAALKAGYTPPTAAATGDLLKRRLELFKGMQDVGREKAAELSVEAEGLQISKSGFRQALNKIPLAAAATDTTPAATENVIKVPELAGPPASAAIGGSNTAPAATPPPLLQRPSSTVIPNALRPVAAIPSAQQLLQESLARTKARESAATPMATAAPATAAAPTPTVSSMAPRTKPVSTLMSKPPLPETAGMPPRVSSSTPSASFTPPTTGEGLSEAENFARLKQSGYTTKQAAALLGLKDKKAPAWMEDSAAAKVYNFLNRY
jgi:hypothetical protein